MSPDPLLPHRLSLTEARRIAVRAQRLDLPRPASLPETVRDLTLLQIDAATAVAPSAELVAWSRLGGAYSSEELAVAGEQRMLVELQGMIRPAEDIALYRADMADWPGRGELTPWLAAKKEWVEANDLARRAVLAELDRSGPVPAAELPDRCVRPWRSSGWNDNRNLGQLLDLMVERGEVAVAGRRRGSRLWDLAERVYPDDPPVGAEEAARRRDELRLRSLGLARARGPETRIEPQQVGSAGEPATVEGVRGVWRVDPHWLAGPFRGRVAVLSPLDRLVFDRKRMAELFDFDYQLEMYKPKTTRRWGYWAMPVLHDERLVGKVDATADRRTGVLRVDAVHQDEPFDADLEEAVETELTGLADWLELELQLPG